MKGAALASLAALLTSCVEPIGSRCGPELPPCPAGQQCVDARCVMAAEDGGLADAGLETDAGSSACPCSPWDECVGLACVPRYSSLIVQASPRSRLPVPVAAALIPIAGRAQNPPQEMAVSASFLPGSVLVRGALRHLGDGGYGGSILTADGGAVPALPATTSGEWTVTVEWPDAGLRGTTHAQIDLDPPVIEVSVPQAPSRQVIVGLTDHRDPLDGAGPPSWRRHERPSITVRSTSSDLTLSTVSVSVATMTIQPGSCGADAGVCVAFAADLSRLPMSTGRATWPVVVRAADDLGNERIIDAGVIGVTRWIMSVDAGTPGLAIASTGELILPGAIGMSVRALTPEGAPLWERPTQLPVQSLAVGRYPTTDGPLVYVLEIDGSENSLGEAFPLLQPARPVRVWAPPAIRTAAFSGAFFLRTGPSGEEVAAVFVASSRPAVLWGTVANGPLRGGVVTATTGPTFSPFIRTIASSGSTLFGSVGLSLFSFEGADGGLGDPTERGVAPTGLAMPLRGLVPLEGGQTLGIASNNPPNDAGTSQFTLLDARLSNGTLSLDAGAVVTGRIVSVRVSRGVAYFVVGDANGCGQLCKAGLGASTMTCDPGPVCGISLSAGDSLITTSPPTPGSTLVQERSRADFSVTWQVPLPSGSWGVSPLCTNASPLVIAGDAAGNLVVIASDARGIDATAQWPLGGHDPSNTFNASTDLSAWACP